MYLHDDKEAFAYLVAQAEKSSGLPGNNVIKDYFICEFLKELVARSPSVVFKGGTALSKCYGVIDRFSEDIDLGMDCARTTEGQRRKLKRAIIDAAAALGLEISNIDETRSRRSFNRYFLPLHSKDSSKNELMVETALMTPASPTATKNISSFIYEYCIRSGLIDVIEQFSLVPFSLTASSLERSFADKVFAVCDYYLTDRVLDRQSRHLYDLHKLLSEVQLDKAMTSLIEQVRKDRQGSDQCPSAREGVDLSALLSTIIDERAYESDYENVTLPLLYEDVSYDESIESLRAIAEFLDSIR